MTALTIETASKPKHTPRTKVERNIKATPSPIRTIEVRSKPQNPKARKSGVQSTKQELVLSLLRRSGGASINEIREATDWQQHSVRGFLSGTVKKKLGLTLTSSKEAEGERRYRIEARRGR
jgi:hypothetical protein